MKRFVVTLTPVRNHQLTRVWKTLEREQIIHKIPRSFEIQTDHIILARIPELVIAEKKVGGNLPTNELCRPGRPQIVNQRKRKERQVLILRPNQRLKMLKNMIVTVIPIVTSALRRILKGLVRRLEVLEMKDDIGLLRSARIPRKVLETWGVLLLVRLQRKDHQLTLVWKTRNKYTHFKTFFLYFIECWDLPRNIHTRWWSLNVFSALYFFIFFVGLLTKLQVILGPLVQSQFMRRKLKMINFRQLIIKSDLLCFWLHISVYFKFYGYYIEQ